MIWKTNTEMMRPFFSFFGGKWRAAPKYPAPIHDTVIEPFAGSAGYSVRNFEKNVILYELDPKIAGLWKYLINVTPAEIRSIPINLDHVDDLKFPEETKWLVGFWFNKGTSQPRKSPSSWMRGGTKIGSFWGERIRERIAIQVDKIRHWTVFNQSYEKCENQNATWFIDPPYIESGYMYKYSSENLNYAHLAEYCKSRKGQVIVCENEGAEWLPFAPYLNIKSCSSWGVYVNKEAAYFQGCGEGVIQNDY